VSLQRPVCHIVIPGLSEAISTLGSKLQINSFPSLELLVARSVTMTFSADYPHLLAQLFGLEYKAEQDVPVAALAAGIRPDNDSAAKAACWVRAIPVMLRPDRDRLVLDMAAPYPPTDKLSASWLSVANEVRQHFSDIFSQVHIADDNSWLFRLASYANISTTPLMDAVGRNVDQLLPRGADRQYWHALLNEVQMLLHDKDSVSLGFNSLWFEGVGELPPEQAKKPCFDIIGDELLLQALARRSAGQVISGPENLGKGNSLIEVNMEILQALCERHETAWMTAVRQLDMHVGKYLHMMKQGVFSSIRLYSLEGKFIEMKASGLYRFWHKKRALADWSD